MSALGGIFSGDRHRLADFRQFGLLLGLMCLWMLGLALLDSFGGNGRIMSAAFAVICVQALWMTAQSSRERILFMLLGIYLFLDPLFVYPLPIEIATSVVIGIFLVFIPIRLSVYVLSQDEVDVNTVFGALCAYLFLGLSFAALYAVVTRITPAAIYTPEDGEPDFVTWVYFSFTTLTTLGYGDIAPRTYPARMLSILEALIGQVYLVVVVARLVGGRMKGDR